MTKFYLAEFAYEGFNKMRRSAVYPYRVNFVTFVYNIKAILETLRRRSVLSIHRAEADPGWYLDVFFLEKLHASLNHFKCTNKCLDAKILPKSKQSLVKRWLVMAKAQQPLENKQ